MVNETWESVVKIQKYSELSKAWLYFDRASESSVARVKELVLLVVQLESVNC